MPRAETIGREAFAQVEACAERGCPSRACCARCSSARWIEAAALATEAPLSAHSSRGGVVPAGLRKSRPKKPIPPNKPSRLSCRFISRAAMEAANPARGSGGKAAKRASVASPSVGKSGGESRRRAASPAPPSARSAHPARGGRDLDGEVLVVGDRARPRPGARPSSPDCRRRRRRRGWPPASGRPPPRPRPEQADGGDRRPEAGAAAEQRKVTGSPLQASAPAPCPPRWMAPLRDVAAAIGGIGASQERTLSRRDRPRRRWSFATPRRAAVTANLRLDVRAGPRVRFPSSTDVDAGCIAAEAGRSSDKPTRRTTPDHRAMSAMMSCWKSSGVLVAASAPCRATPSRTSGVPRTATVSACIRRTTGSGVPAGASSPSQYSTVKPGRPASATVGSAGISGVRRALVTASARSRPASTCGSTGGRPIEPRAMRPASRSVSCGPPPLYGTCGMSRPAACLKSSMARCWSPPAPDDP